MRLAILLFALFLLFSCGTEDNVGPSQNSTVIKAEDDILNPPEDVPFFGDILASNSEMFVACADEVRCWGYSVQGRQISPIPIF